jgi:hypothetical protein
MEKQRRLCVIRLVKNVGLIALGILIVYLLFANNIARPLNLSPGWQKLTAMDGVVPKGTIMVVTESSNLVVPGDGEINIQTGYFKEGIVIFYQKQQCFSEGSVWVYCPEKYDFFSKAKDLMIQCDSKLVDLTGNKDSKVQSMYFVGHP